MAEKTIQAKTLKRSRSYSIGTIHGYTVQKILNAQTALAEVAKLALLGNMDPPYISFNLWKIKSFVLCKREQDFAAFEQSHHLPHEMSTVNNVDDVNNRIWNRPSQLDAELWFATYLYLDQIDSAVSNTLYPMQKG